MPPLVCVVGRFWIAFVRILHHFFACLGEKKDFSVCLFVSLFQADPGCFQFSARTLEQKSFPDLLHNPSPVCVTLYQNRRMSQFAWPIFPWTVCCFSSIFTSNKSGTKERYFSYFNSSDDRRRANNIHVC